MSKLNRLAQVGAVGEVKFESLGQMAEHYPLNTVSLQVGLWTPTRQMQTTHHAATVKEAKRTAAAEVMERLIFGTVMPQPTRRTIEAHLANLGRPCSLPRDTAPSCVSRNRARPRKHRG